MKKVIEKVIDLDLNPRYCLYAFSCGHTPKQQLKIDKRKYRGGCMAGYITWVDKMAKQWQKENNVDRITNQDSFDDWLENVVVLQGGYDKKCSRCGWFRTKEQIKTGICLNCDSRNEYGNFKEII